MTEYTRADEEQNKEINSDTHRIAALEQSVRELQAHKEITIRQLGNHGARLDELDPLRGLLEFVEHIKEIIKEWRLK